MALDFKYKYPYDYRKIKKDRLKLLNRLKYADRATITAIEKKCKNDPVFFINAFGWTHDPRKADTGGAKIPFILWKKQEEFIRWLHKVFTAKVRGEDRSNLVIDKARDSGATWLCSAFSAWIFKYYPESVIGWGSRKEELVDRGEDPKTIFFKIRYFLNNLPKQLRVPIKTSHMKVINLANGSAIVGEAGKNIGRGGRFCPYFKDESAFYANPESIEAALGEATDMQVDISTHNGTGSLYYNKVETYNRDCKFVFDYRDCPWKTLEWYNKKRIAYEKSGILHKFEEEINRNPSGSIENTVILHYQLKACIGAFEKLGIKTTGTKKASFDIADGGKDKSAVVIKHGNEIVYCNEYSSIDVGTDTAKAVQILDNNLCYDLKYDAVGVGSGVGSDIKTRNTNRTNKINYEPYKGSHGVVNPKQNYCDGLKNEELFINIKAQGWWKLRVLVQNTYKAVEHGEPYELDEIISFNPEMNQLNELIKQLCQPTHSRNDRGQIVIDKKPNGSKSPNLADAVQMLFAPEKNTNIYSEDWNWG